MHTEQNRRNFLKQGITFGTGIICCCAGLSCTKQREITKTETAPQDFSKLAYCTFECEKKCKIFAATKNNDLQAKAKIAERWSEKFGREFKAQDVACYGCKTENTPLGQYAEKCTVRKCARQRQLPTCAHCDDFPACEKQLWKDWPKMRENVERLRTELQAQPKT